MSDTTPAGAGMQPWSDNKIANALQHRSWYLDKHQRILAIEYATAFNVAIKMRDEYKAALATATAQHEQLQQRVQELESELFKARFALGEWGDNEDE